MESPPPAFPPACVVEVPYKGLTGYVVWLVCCVFLVAVSARVQGASPFLAAAPEGVVESGLPPHEVHSLATLGVEGDCFDLKSLPDGRLLVVAAQHLVVGDGVRWKVIPRSAHERHRLVGQVAMDPEGRLFCEQVDGFYRIDFDEAGRWYLSPCPPLTPDEGILPALYHQRWLGGESYWHGTGLVRWTPGKEQEPRRIYAGKVDTVFMLGGALYFSDPIEARLHRVLEDGRTEMVSLAESPGFTSVLAAVPYDQTRVLVSTPSLGLGLFDGARFQPLGGTRLFSGEALVSSLVSLDKGRFAAVVEDYGLVVFDREGRVLQHLDAKVDRHFEQLGSLHVAPDGSIWALGGNAVIRLVMPSALTYVSPLNTSGNRSASLVRHEGRLWLMNGRRILRGVYEEGTRLSGFVEDSPRGVEVLSLHALEGHLVACTQQGLYERREGDWRCVDPLLINGRITRRSSRTGLWFFTARDQVGWVDAHGWELQVRRSPWPGMQRSYYDILDTQGRCWLELGVGRLARIDLEEPEPALRLYGAQEGVPSGWPELYLIDGRVRLHSAHRCLIHEEAKNRFVADSTLSQEYPMLTEVSGRPNRDALGRLWGRSPHGVQIISEEKDRSPKIEYLAGNQHPLVFLPEEKGVMWMMDFRRLMRYDPSLGLPSPPPLKALISSLELPGTGRGWLNFMGQVPRLGPEDDVAVFHFMLPGLPLGQKAGFEVKVEGLDTGWVDMGTQSSTLLNRLRAGSYVLHVRPVVEGRPGEEDSLAFVVDPPWYKTPLAYLVFGALLALVISGLIGWELHKKRQLAFLVEQRTSELRAREEQLCSLNQDLHSRIAEQQRMEEQLVQFRKMESVGQLAGGVAHDFNNMLTPIMNYAMMLRDEFPKTDRRWADLNEIVTSALRARDLTRQLLAFARKQKLALQPLQLGQVLAGLERMLRRTLRENVVIELDLQDGAARIQADKSQIEQVILNLAINAQDAMPDGGRLRIGTSVLRREVTTESVPQGEYVCLTVSDTGHGMDETIKARIFDPFFTTKELGRGTGLGLSTVYGIVRQHQAHIEVESEPDKGTRFTILFLAVRGGERWAEATESGEPTTVAAGGLVLLVEDQPQVRRATLEVLLSLGYEVVEASSGAEALDLAARQTKPIRLLVTDVIMDGLNGVELERELRPRCPGLRTLYMSGYPAEVVGRHGVLRSGLHFLQKPFTPAELSSACQKVLRGA